MSDPQSPDQNHTEYNLPRNDAAEFARLEDQADAHTEFMSQKIIHAPLHHPQKILEVGCGTGNVCRQLAQQFPSATILGVDITPVPPFPNTPPNISYITGDIRQVAASDQRLKNGALDYIFGRLLLGGMTSWPTYIRQMTALLREGGYLEMQEMACGVYKCSSAVPSDDDELISEDWDWYRAVRQGTEQLGLDFDVGCHAQRYMREAGLVDVVQKRYVLPFGTWLGGETRRLGQQQGEVFRAVFTNSILPGVTRGLGIAERDMRRMKEECWRCLGNEEGKYWYFYVTVGRKP
ncbi:MAG: hypothetical protein Q9195_009602 [Heterodermia aff. obscurata]